MISKFIMEVPYKSSICRARGMGLSYAAVIGTVGVWSLLVFSVIISICVWLIVEAKYPCLLLNQLRLCLLT